MELPRRNFLRLAAGSVALPVLPRFAFALDYPIRSVHIIVGFAAAANPDIVARLIAEHLYERLGQEFIVDDRPGASSNIGTGLVAHARPDGYTLLAVTSSNTVNETLYKNLNFDFARDIAPIAGTVRLPDILTATPSFPATTVPELIAYAEANPGKVTFASNGVGTASHVIGELFEAMTGTKLLHIPYRTNYMPDLLAGEVQLAFTPIAQSVGYVRDGRLRALAVTSATRSDALPKIPAVAEFVPGYEGYVWDGIGAPKGTPTEIVTALNEATNAALADSDVKARLSRLGAEPMPMKPAEFERFIADEIAKWARVIRLADIKPE
jgi:tripartite-type tricarboxylate transporter receptor subunit TctC